MELTASTRKLARALADERECARQYGADQAKKVALRMASLRAALCLADFWPPNSGSERCHELVADLKGKFSMDLKQPYRLLFRAPGVDGAGLFEDDRARWTAIRAVEIIAIEDTHG